MISIEILRDALSYNLDTGSLTWKKRPENHFRDSHTHLAWNGKWAGKSAGAITHESYRQIHFTVIGLPPKLIKSHRAIWAIQTGQWPKGDIDHINGDRSDNRFSNLRDCSHAENLQNLSNRPQQKNPYTGATFSKKDKRWIAQIRSNGKKLTLGSYGSPEEAHAAYVAAKSVLHSFSPVLRDCIIPNPNREGGR